MKLHAHVRFRGEFRYVLKEKERIVSEGSFPNLILDSGLDMIGNEAPTYGPVQLIMQYLSVGTNNTAPAVGQTALGAYVASVAREQPAFQYGAGTSPDYAVSFTQTYFFDEGTFSGQTLAELGVGKSDDGSNLWCRALIADADGNPTTITVLASHTLTIYYTVYSYPQVSDGVDDLDYNGDDTTYNYRTRAIAIGSYTYWAFTGGGMEFGHLPTTGDTLEEVTAWSGGIVANTGFRPSGTSSAGLVQNVSTYVNGNFYLDAEMFFAAGSGNWPGGIGAFMITTTLGTWQFRREDNSGVASPVPKTSSQTLTIGLRVSWGRYT